MAINRDLPGTSVKESGKAIRVIIADPHTLFRETLKKLFDSERRFLVIGEAGDGEETLKLVRLLEPDILLMDWFLPRLSGTDVLRSLSSSETRTRSIVLSAEISPDQVPQAFRLGTRGLVLKQSTTDVLFLSMCTIMEGRYWLGSESFENLEQVFNTLTDSTCGDMLPRNLVLTQRELKVIAGVAIGQSNKEIAQQLSISEQTVKHHITRIFDKVQVRNRLELTLFALNRKLIDDSD